MECLTMNLRDADGDGDDTIGLEMDEQVWKLFITIPSAYKSTKVEVQILQVSEENEEEERKDGAPAYCVDFKRIEGSEIVYSDEAAKYLRWFDIDMGAGTESEEDSDENSNEAADEDADGDAKDIEEQIR